MICKIPKTSQLYYYLMPEETSMVLEFIKEQQCIIYSSRSSTSEPIECEDDVPIKVFFCPEELSNEIDMNKISESIYALDPRTSPVIEMQCSVLRKSDLARGRIYFRGGYAGRDEWVSFPAGLYELFKRVSTFMKKTFLKKEKKNGAYVSKGCQSFISGGGDLAQI